MCNKRSGNSDSSKRKTRRARTTSGRRKGILEQRWVVRENSKALSLRLNASRVTHVVVPRKYHASPIYLRIVTGIQHGRRQRSLGGSACTRLQR